MALPKFSIELAAAMAARNLSNQQAADLIGVARPTIARWKEGKNLPYRFSRPLVLKAISGNQT